MLNIITFIVFIVSLGAIAAIVGRKMPILKEIKLEEVKREKHKKRSLLEERLKRKLRAVSEKISAHGFAVRSLARLSGKFQKGYQYVQSKRSEYWNELIKKRRRSTEGSAPEHAHEEDERKLLSAEELMNKEKFDDAEKTALSVIKRDPKSLHAYKLLAEIYVKSKNLLHAEATWEHVVKLAQRLKTISAVNYLKLAETKLRLEKLEDALQSAKKALTLEPSNPKMLHFITKVCILAKQKELGWKYYLKLKKINPDNEGLDELLLELKGIG